MRRTYADPYHGLPFFADCINFCPSSLFDDMLDLLNTCTLKLQRVAWLSRSELSPDWHNFEMTETRTKVSCPFLNSPRPHPPFRNPQRHGHDT